MNKENDLIRRGDVKAKKVYCLERHEYVVSVAEIDWLSPVEQPMSAVEYAHYRARMCVAHEALCRDCPLDRRSIEFEDVCVGFELSHPEDAVAIVQKWAAEHPEEVNNETN